MSPLRCPDCGALEVRESDTHAAYVCGACGLVVAWKAAQHARRIGRWPDVIPGKRDGEIIKMDGGQPA